MSEDRKSSYSMPPGLKSQILLAVAITAAAVLLPTAMSIAAGVDQPAGQACEEVSAGLVTTTTRAFDASDFPASAFTDWER